MQHHKFEERSTDRRSERVNSTLKRELGALIVKTLKDPRLGRLTSVTSVRASHDLARATVEVSVFGGPEEQDLTLQALRSAAGKLRELLKSRVRMRQIPELHFGLDKSLERGTEMLALMDEVNRRDEEVRQERGRGLPKGSDDGP